MLEFVEKFSYLGLFLILLAEEGGVPLPIPGDIFIATVAALPQSNYFLTVVTVVAATCAGSTILFSLARIFGHRLIVKLGKYIRLTPDKINKIEAWFEKHGGKTILIGRLIPGLRIITPAVAGIFEVSYKTFWVYTVLAAFIWANLYFLAGRLFGNIIEKVARF